MNGGSGIFCTSSPLTSPNPPQTARPSAMARSGDREPSAAVLAITMLPNAITAPHDRSMPAVRMIRVWPMARAPTTMTCCTISEKLPPVRNWSVEREKKAQASRRATSGPVVGAVSSLRAMVGTGSSS